MGGCTSVSNGFEKANGVLNARGLEGKRWAQTQINIQRAASLTKFKLGGFGCQRFVGRLKKVLKAEMHGTKREMCLPLNGPMQW